MTRRLIAGLLTLCMLVSLCPPNAFALRSSAAEISVSEPANVETVGTQTQEPENKEPEVQEPEDKGTEVQKPEDKGTEVQKPEDKGTEVQKPEDKGTEVQEPEDKGTEVQKPEDKGTEVQEPEDKETEVQEPEAEEPNYATVAEGKTITLTASSEAGGSWSSSNVAVATAGGRVDGAGRAVADVYGVAEGFATVTYTLGDKVETWIVTVTAAPTEETPEEPADVTYTVSRYLEEEAPEDAEEPFTYTLIDTISVTGKPGAEVTLPAVSGAIAVNTDADDIFSNEDGTAALTLPAEAPEELSLTVYYVKTESRPEIDDLMIVDPETKIDTYKFVVDGVTVSTQKIKGDEKVNTPASPEKKGYKFTGWYNGTAEFDPVNLPAVEGKERVYTAAFEEVYYVYFMDNQGRVKVTKEYTKGQYIVTSDVSFPIGSNLGIDGWSLTNIKEQQSDVGDGLAVTEEDITLYPIVVKGFWITYNTNGGTIMEPDFLYETDKTEKPADPEKPGYTFGGWTLKGADYTFGENLVENITLDAVWTANTNTPYTIVYWIENADDDGYSYEGQRKTNGTTDTVIVLSDNDDGYGTGNINADYRDGFTFEKYDTGKTIAGDGSTIVNVYYKRNVYTINFWPTGGSSSSTTIICGKEEHTHSRWDGCYTYKLGTGWVLTCTKEEHTHNDSCKKTTSSGALFTITAKYGARISEQWQKSADVNGGSTNWSTQKNGGQPWQAGIDVMPLGGGNFYVPTNAGSYSSSAQYYVEVLEGEDGTVEDDGRTYKLHHTDTIKSNNRLTVSKEDFYDITGFSKNEEEGMSTSIGSSYNGAKFYYIRKSYNLEFYNVNTTAKTESVKYQAPLTGYYDYTPERPVGVDPNYEFQGWYTSPACEAGTEAATKLTTMPAGNRVVYAKWAAPEKTAEVHVDIALGSNSKTLKVPYGQKINPEDLKDIKAPVGSTWDGSWVEWTGKAFVPFDINTTITRDVVLYPNFISTDKYTVTYNANGGTGTFTDTKAYNRGAIAGVLHGTSLEAPEGKVFLGWALSKDATAPDYKPGDKFQIMGDTTLYAIWGPKAALATLTYHPNGGKGTATTEKDHLNNESVTLKNYNDETLNFTRPGYSFVGWSKNPSATTAEYTPGNTIIVDNTSANTLYAVWTVQSITVTYTAGANGSVTNTSDALAADGDSMDNGFTGSKATPAKNYKFVGWYKSETLVSSAATLDLTTVKANLNRTTDGVYDNTTFTAKFELDVADYTVRYVWNGVEIATAKTVTGTTIGTEVTETPATVPGYTPKVTSVTETTTADTVITIEYYKNVVLTANSDTVTYDGKSHSVSGFKIAAEVEDSNSIDGADFSAITVGATGTAAGTYYANFAESTVGTVDATGKYKVVTANNGTLVINPISDEIVVTIQENSGTYTYDGTEKKVEGYTVKSISSELYTASDFDFSGNAVVTGTTEGTYDMELKAEDFANTNSNFTNVKFVIVDGTLVINPISDKIVVTIQENSGTYTYDGTEKKVEGYTVKSISSELYTASDFDFSGNAVVTGTTEGTYDMELKAEDFANTNSNFTNVKFVIVDGTLVINPTSDEIVVTIQENSGTYTYDGTEKKVEGYTVKSISSELYTASDFDFSGNAVVTGTTEGTYDMELKAEDFANTNSNFTNVKFVIVDGALVINPISDEIVVTIQENSGTYTYDGTEKKVEGYTVKSISSELYTASDFDFSGNAVVTGTTEGTYDMELKAEDFANTNSNFTNVKFVIVDGTLVINPISDEIVVTIQENSGTYTYDGTEKKVEGYTVKSISSELYTASDFSFSGNAVVTGTTEGTYDMKLKASDFANTNSNFTNVKFVIVDGTLVINPISDEIVVTIQENSGTYTYDGTEKKVEGYTVKSISSELYTASDFDFSGNAVVTGTTEGTYDMELKAEDFANTNSNFTNVKFVIVDGTLVINPTSDEIVVTIQENSGTYTYDGTEKKVEGYTVKSISSELYTASDFDFSGNAVVTGTTEGTYDMELKAEDFANTNSNFTNVKFVIVDGTLVINPISDEIVVTIQENSGTYTYDGTEKKVEGYTVKSISSELYTASDFDFSGNAVVTGTTEGTYDMELKAEDFANTNSNFTNVKFVIVDGTLVINPTSDEIVVTIQENSGTYTYDGTEKKVEGYTVKSISSELYTASDFDFSGNAVVTGTTEGTYDMELKAEDFANTNSNFTNVKFVIVDGTLVINPISDEIVVTIQENSGTYTYDGTEKKVEGYTVKSISSELYTASDFDFSGNAVVTGTTEGTYDMELKAEDFANTNSNFTNVKFVIVDGTLVINPTSDEIVVTIQENSGTYTYDGTEKKVEGYTVKSISSELYTASDFDFSGNAVVTGTTEGTYDMELKAEDFANTNSNFTNVKFVIVDGTLVINPTSDEIVVTIQENSGTYTYDGTEKKVEGYTVKSISSELYTASDFDFSGNAVVTGTTEGTYDMELKAEDFANTNSNFTNVKFVIVDGTLVINPISDEIVVTIQENSGTYTYDGTEKKVEGYTVKSISSELYTASDFDFSGNAVVTGTTEGTYDMELKAEDFANTNSNFTNVKFVIVDGTLVINPTSDEIVVTIQENSGTYTYDGTEKKVEGYTVKSISSELYTASDFDFSGNAVVTGTTEGTYDMELKAEDFANTNSNFTNVKFVIVDGTLVINPTSDEIVVTIQENSGTYTYDGTEKKVEGYTVKSISSELYTASDFDFSGNAVVTGTTEGTYDMELKAEDFANTNSNFTNVKFVIVDGTLVINPTSDEIVVTIQENSGTYTYDGTEKKVEGYTVKSISSELYTASDFDFSGNAVVTGTTEGTYDMELKAEDFANTNSNFTNVKFVIVDGTLVINPTSDEIVVTIQENSGTYTYDGTEKKVEGYTVKSISSELYTASDFDFSGNAVVTGTTEGTYDMELKAEDFANTNSNFTNVKFVIVDGTLVINPISDEIVVTIQENSGTYTYDGTEKKVEGYTVKSISSELYTASDFDFSGNAVVTGTNANTYNMELKASDFANTNRNFTNVRFVIEDGTLVITAKSILPAGPDTSVTVSELGNKIYNGASQKQEPVVTDSETKQTLKKGTDYTLSYSTDTINVGTVTVTVTGTGNYTGTVTRTYQITKRTVILTSETASKTYDGTPLTKPDVTVTGNGFVTGEVSDIKATGSVTTVADGEKTNTIVYTEETGFKADNYEITKNEGTLTITAQSITEPDPENPDPSYLGVTVGNLEDVVYNGLSQEQKPAVTDKGGDALAENTDYTLSWSPATNVGTVTVTVTGIGNYTGTVTRTYEITKAPYTVTTYSAIKVYDGNPLTAGGIVNGLVNGETCTVNTTASRTEYGTTQNKPYTLTWGTAKESNYEFKGETIGTLTVLRQSINPTDPPIPTDPDGEKPIDPDQSYYGGVEVKAPENVKYNGQSQEQKPVVTDKDGTALVENTDYTLSYSKDTVNAGTVTVTVTGKGNYQGKVEVTYQITKRTVTLTSEDGSKVYDGTPLTKPGVVVGGDGFVEGEVTAINATGTVTNVTEGKVKNAITYTEGTGFKAGNYEITKVEGELYVTKAKEGIVTVTGNSETYVWTGDEHEVTGFTHDGAARLITVELKKGAEAAARGTAVGTYAMGLKAENFTASSPNYETVKVVVVDGELVIETINITVTVTVRGNKEIVTFDGNPHTVTGYKVISAIANTGRDMGMDGFTLTLKGTASATGTEIGTYNMGLTAGDFTITSDIYRVVRVVVEDGGLEITPAPEEPTEEIPEETVPLAPPEEIPDEPVPQAAGPAWALINLILSILTVLASLLLLVGYFGKKEEEAQDENGNPILDAEGNSLMNNIKKRGGWRLASLVPAILSVIAFLLTENMRNPMILVDRWTLLMVIIAVAQVLVMLLSKKKTEEDAQEA